MVEVRASDDPRAKYTLLHFGAALATGLTTLLLVAALLADSYLDATAPAAALPYLRYRAGHWDNSSAVADGTVSMRVGLFAYCANGNCRRKQGGGSAEVNHNATATTVAGTLHERVGFAAETLRPGCHRSSGAIGTLYAFGFIFLCVACVASAYTTWRQIRLAIIGVRAGRRARGQDDRHVARDDLNLDRIRPQQSYASPTGEAPYGEGDDIDASPTGWKTEQKGHFPDDDCPDGTNGTRHEPSPHPPAPAAESDWQFSADAKSAFAEEAPSFWGPSQSPGARDASMDNASSPGAGGSGGGAVVLKSQPAPAAPRKGAHDTSGTGGRVATDGGAFANVHAQSVLPNRVHRAKARNLLLGHIVAAVATVLAMALLVGQQGTHGNCGWATCTAMNRLVAEHVAVGSFPASVWDTYACRLGHSCVMLLIGTPICVLTALAAAVPSLSWAGQMTAA